MKPKESRHSRQGKARPRLSLRFILFALAFGPALLFSTAVFLIGDAASRRANEAIAARAMAEAIGQTAARLDALLAQAERARTLTEQRLARGALTADDLDAWVGPMLGDLAAFRDLGSVTWGSEAGHALWASRTPAGYELAKQSPGGPLAEFRLGPTLDPGAVAAAVFLREYAYDARRRPWYLAAGADGEPAWSDVYTWVGSNGGGGAEISVASVRRLGVPVAGVVSVDVSLRAVSDYLARLPVAEEGVIAVSDRDGRLIAISDGPLVGDDGRRRVVDDALAAAGVERHDERRPDDPATLRDPRMRTVRLDGEGARLMTEAYARAGGLTWDVRVVVPESSFLGAVIESRRRASFVFFGSVVGVLALTLLIGKIAGARIEGVLGFVRRVAAGDFEARVEEADPREWQELTSTLNRMASELGDYLNTRRALEVAQEVQRSLLPAAMPEAPGLDVYAHNEPCDETGGDYYDFDQGPIEEGRLLFTVGDVTGHGVAAALLMATARAALWAVGDSGASLGTNMQRVNEQLARDARHGRFMTLFLAEIDLPAGRISWASAGHDPLILYDPRGDTFTEPDGGGLPLAVLESETYETYTLTGVAPGSVLFVGTDGIWEAANPDRELFGKQRLRDTIRAHADRPARDIGRAIDAAVAAHRGEAPQADDVTYIVIKFT